MKKTVALILSVIMVLSGASALFLYSASAQSSVGGRNIMNADAEGDQQGEWPDPTYQEMTTEDYDTDAGTLTYQVSADGSTVTISYVVNGETRSFTVPNNQNYLFGGYGATDDLDRDLYTSETVGSYGTTGERYVGLFYFLWHGEHGDSGVYDLQKIIDENGLETAGKVSSGLYSGVGAMHWFAEPLYGYYYANDAWVLRKHAELLTNANIDFLYFDVTNGYSYKHNATVLMGVLHELNEQGYDAPQVVFYTHSSAANVVKDVYDNIYAKGLYEDTWFKIDGKPVIVAPYEANIDDFFTIKREQWPNEGSNVNGWPWMDFSWPARIFPGIGADGKKDGRNAISVSVAQHSGNTVFSSSALYGYTANRGRSFAGGEKVRYSFGGTYSDKYSQALTDAWQRAQDDPTLSYQGLNFQAQWDRAIESEATYVLVTGWNEWVAQRQNPSILGDDKVVFIDTGSVEYSRDTEMMRGGYFDNYYMQLIYNVQRLKGTAPIVVQDSRNPVNVTGDFDQWDKVQVVYTDPKGDTVDRDATGFGRTHYTNTTGRNDIVASKVTSDSKNLYFYVQTADEITMFDNSTSWMQLYLDADSSTETGWYGYDFMVNYMVKDEFTTTVSKYVDGDWVVVSDASYRVKGNQMMVAVPLSVIGVDGYREICVQFKWADSIEPYSSMENFYENGDAAPLGRLNYIYQNYIPGVSEIRYPENETEPDTEAPTEPETEAPTLPETEAPTVPETTEAPTVAEEVTTAGEGTADETTGESGTGCSSVVGSAACLILVGVLCGAGVMRKRKH